MKTTKYLVLLASVLMLVMGMVIGTVATIDGTTADTVTVSYLSGDVNGDGEINNKDLIRLKKYLSDEAGVELEPIHIQLNADAVFAFEQNGEEAVLVSCKGHYPNLVIPATYNGLPVTTIKAGAFAGCTKLTSVTFEMTEGWTAGGTALDVTDPATAATYLTSTYVDVDWIIAPAYTEGLVFKLNDDQVSYSVTDYTGSSTEVVIPAIYEGLPVTSIGFQAFYECSSLAGVTIGNSVTYIGSDAFSGCSSLTTITIPDSVTGIGPFAFFDCSSLTTITIPDSVTSIGDYAFEWCESLTTITIPDSVTSIGDSAFYGCSSLTTITIPDSVIGIGSGAFYGCSSLTSITIPDSVTSIGYSAFGGCSKLASVTFENPNGWWRSFSSTATSGTAISADSLADPATAATYLRSTYYGYYWKRS